MGEYSKKQFEEKRLIHSFHGNSYFPVINKLLELKRHTEGKMAKTLEEMLAENRAASVTTGKKVQTGKTRIED